MKFASGDVCLVDFGDEYGGHRQIGIRPAIVVRKVADVVLVIPLTSNDKALRFEGTVSIKPNALSGLTKPSVALLFQIQPIDVPEIIKKIGLLSEKDKRTIDSVLRKVVRLQ
ncbi:MAG: type II toxin-antitoxin system PemK/MazF family toxin [Patescibacteria group bacterium]